MNPYNQYNDFPYNLCNPTNPKTPQNLLFSELNPSISNPHLDYSEIKSIYGVLILSKSANKKSSAVSDLADKCSIRIIWVSVLEVSF